MDFLLGILFAFIALFSWSISDIITKLSLNKTSKWKVLFLTNFSGVALILLFGSYLGEISLISIESFAFLLFLGFMNFIGMFTFYKSLDEKGLALTSPLINAWAIITIVLGVVFYNEQLTVTQLLGAAAIFLGIFAISIKRKFIFDKGFLAAIISMILWGLFSFLLKIPLLFVSASMIVIIIKSSTSLFTLPIILKEKIDFLDIRGKLLLMIFIVGILDSFGFLVYNYSIATIGVSLTAPIVTASPVLSVIFGVFFLKEKLNNKQKIGIFLTLAGLLLLSIL